MIADWLVQGQINDTLDQVKEKSAEVSRLLHELEAAKRKLEAEWAEAHRKYVQMVELYG